MVKTIELDEQVNLCRQLQQNVGPVILINTYTVNPDDEDKFIRTWGSAAYISKKTSMIS